MTKIFRGFLAAGLIATSLAFVACLDDDETTTSSAATFDASTMLTNYGSNIIVYIYDDLAMESETLETAVMTFVATPNEANLIAAQDAWRAARLPWENSEAFLFGPVDNGGFDPRLDSWPVNRIDLDNVLGGAATIDAAFIDAQDDDRRGFHTIEYLLFDDGAGSRVAADIVAAFMAQPRRGLYVQELCTDLADTAEELANAWRATGTNFVSEIVDAGDMGKTLYPSQKSALLEMLNGMSVIADEVANGKIADPFGPNAAGSDATLVESQFSFNSIADFQNNIRGILAVYTGDHDGNTGVGLDAYITQRDAVLAQRFLDEVNAAIAAIGAISDPFRDAIVNDRVAVQAAIDAVQTVFNTIENDLRPLVNSGTFIQ